MNKMASLAAALLLSAPLQANEPCAVIDFSKVDAKQYCVFDGKLYSRGIRIKTDTGTYTCRIAETKLPGQADASRELLSWVRETI